MSRVSSPKPTASLALLAALLAASACDSGSSSREPLRFPRGFQWGVAGSAHESEGRNVHSDFQAFEEMGRVPPAGWAQNAYELFDLDNANAASLNLNTVQLGIEWARLVPARPVDPFAPLTRNGVDPAALAHYHDVIDSVVAHGMEPVVAVTHFSLPQWVDNPQAYDREGNRFTDDSLGGWTSRDTGRALASYAAFLVEEFGDQVRRWITTDEPLVVMLAGYMTGDFPPGIVQLSLTRPNLPGGVSLIDVMKNMIDAHARAYHAMKAVREDILVSFAHNTVAWSPKDPANPGDVEAAKRVDLMYNLVFLDALARGEFDTSLTGAGPMEIHPEWAGTLDYLGVNFYDHDYVVGVPGLLPPLEAFPCSPALEGALPPFVWKLFRCPASGLSEPEGMTRMLLEYHDRYGLPQLITENGFIDTPEGKARRLVEILAAVHAAIRQGVPVVGYHYWTLVYDYEWNSGWTEDMGLYTFAGMATGLPPGPDGGPGAPGPDTDFARIPLHPVVDVYAEIAGTNSLPLALIDRYLPAGP